MIAPASRPRLAARARLRFDHRDGCWLLIYPERALALNASALAVVRLLTGEHDVDEIVRRVAGHAGAAERGTVERAVLAFLERLHERCLLAADR
jgi:coenzyme PQQ biosynthesis protein PqqD